MSYKKCVVCTQLFKHQIKCTVWLSEDNSSGILSKQHLSKLIYSYCRCKTLKICQKNVVLLAKTRQKKTTYHFEVLRSALCAVKVAGEEHVVDVVAGAVVEFPHVEGSRLEVVEISFDLEALQNALLHEVYVPDLIPGQTDGQKWEARESFRTVQMQILQCSCEFLCLHRE